MYDREAYIAILFFTFCGMVMAKIIWSTFIEPIIKHTKINIPAFYRKLKYHESYVSDAEVAELVKQSDKTLDKILKSIDEKSFFEMVENYNSGKIKDTELLGNSTELPVLVPCKFHECPMHVTREDHCNSVVELNGQQFCTVLIDFNTMQEVGVKHYSETELKTMMEKPQPLTKDEVKEFTQLYLKFMNYFNSENE